MGSYDQAKMTGFICRLCSELHKSVVHIFSDKGIEMQLEKMITYIPIQVSRLENLPQTVCHSCITKLGMQYKLVEQIKRARKKFIEQREARTQTVTLSCSCPLVRLDPSQFRSNRDDGDVSNTASTSSSHTSTNVENTQNVETEETESQDNNTSYELVPLPPSPEPRTPPREQSESDNENTNERDSRLDTVLMPRPARRPLMTRRHDSSDTDDDLVIM